MFMVEFLFIIISPRRTKQTYSPQERLIISQRRVKPAEPVGLN